MNALGHAPSSAVGMNQILEEFRLKITFNHDFLTLERVNGALKTLHGLYTTWLTRNRGEKKGIVET